MFNFDSVTVLYSEVWFSIGRVQYSGAELRLRNCRA